MAFRVGSFNMHKLAASSNRDFDAIAEMIHDARIDVVALQEIFSEGKGIEYFLIHRLGPEWRYSASESVDTTGEGYAYIWNTRRLDLSKTKVHGIYREAQPHIWKRYRKEFMPSMHELRREPYYIRLTNEGKHNGPVIELRLINTHIRYQKENEVSTSTKEQRKEELNALIKGIYPRISDKRYGNFYPSVTILLGDYNLCIKNGENDGPFLDKTVNFGDISSMRESAMWKVETVQDKKTTIKHKSDDNEEAEEDRYSMNYDHFSFDGNKISAIVNDINRIDPIQEGGKFSGDFNRYLKDVSDHIPVVMEIDFEKRDELNVMQIPFVMMQKY